MKKNIVNLAAAAIIISTSFIACFDTKPKATDNPNTGADTIQKADTVQGVSGSSTTDPALAPEGAEGTGAKPVEGAVKAEPVKGTEGAVKQETPAVKTK